MGSLNLTITWARFQHLYFLICKSGNILTTDLLNGQAMHSFPVFYIELFNCNSIKLINIYSIRQITERIMNYSILNFWVEENSQTIDFCVVLRRQWVRITNELDLPVKTLGLILFGLLWQFWFFNFSHSICKS